jgi:hypothetical protein
MSDWFFGALQVRPGQLNCFGSREHNHPVTNKTHDKSFTIFLYKDTIKFYYLSRSGVSHSSHSRSRPATVIVTDLGRCVLFSSTSPLANNNSPKE